MIKLGRCLVGGIYIIHTKNSKASIERKKRMNKQMKKKKFKANFYQTQLHSNPILGCLESHLNVIKLARKMKMPNVLILEDDAFVLTPQLEIPLIPTNYDMLYLGANVQKVLDPEIEVKDNWKRICGLTTHAYIVHSKMYNKLIGLLTKEKNSKCPRPIDVFYCNDIHPEHQVYVHDPPLVTQSNGYSIIEGKEISYNQLIHKNLDYFLTPPENIDSAEMVVSGENTTLKLLDIPNDDLPKVSIVTPTYMRTSIFPLAVRNFYKTNYPKEKLEWIIVEESSSDTPLEDLVGSVIPDDPRIKYIKVTVSQKGQKLTIGQKRNLCNECATGEYIVHMDDDDLYYPWHILSRIKTLLKYPNKSLVGSTEVISYDLLNNATARSYDLDPHGKKTRICEATMAYKKSFWLEHKFDEQLSRSEGFRFIYKRHDQVITIPSEFIMVAFTHNKNLTNHTRRIDSESDQNINIYDTFDSETQEFVTCIKETL